MWLVEIDKFGMGSLGTEGVSLLTVDGVKVVLEAAEGVIEDNLLAGGSDVWSSRLRFLGHGLQSYSGIGVTGDDAEWLQWCVEESG